MCDAFMHNEARRKARVLENKYAAQKRMAEKCASDTTPRAMVSSVKLSSVCLCFSFFIWNCLCADATHFYQYKISVVLILSDPKNNPLPSAKH